MSEIYNLMKSINEDFDIPVGYAKDIDYMKPYNILSNVIAIQAKDAKNKGNKERVRTLQKNYTLICKQAFKQILTSPQSEEVTILNLITK